MGKQALGWDFPQSPHPYGRAWFVDIMNISGKISYLSCVPKIIYDGNIIDLGEEKSLFYTVKLLGTQLLSTS